MNQEIASAPIDPDSAAITTWLANNGGFGLGRIQIDFSIEVLDRPPGTAVREFLPTDDFYTPDCDRVRFPVPDAGALEGESGYACISGGDCHLIVVDWDAMKLFEMWRADIAGETFRGGCAVLWDLARVYPEAGRGEQCTSADAAGLPIAPLLFSADEVAAGEIAHAIRFVLPNARMRRGSYVHPATHAGNPTGPAPAPIYGSRWRLRAGFDLARLPNEPARVVARALMRYGMVLADGGNVALTAQSDRFTRAKWSSIGFGPRDLALIKPTEFDVIDAGPPLALTYECRRTPIHEF